MKREIKFRAWDEEEGMMHPPFTINEICEIRKEGGGFGAILMNFNWDQLMWLQFTGLKDKNGKEIYEGDIWLMNGIKSQPMIVCFDNGKFISKSTWGEYLKRDDGYTYWDFIDGEVIGNIYENPELLN